MEVRKASQLSKDIRSLHERYDDFLFHLPEAYIEVDILATPPRLTYMNRLAFELFGLDEADLAAGIDFQDLFDDGEYERAYEVIRQQACKNVDSHDAPEPIPSARLDEFRMKGRNRTIFYAETQSSYVLNEDRLPVKMRSLIRDVTHRKQAEEARLESEQKYRLLIENTGMPITICDLSGKILLINEVGARNLRSTPEALLNKPMQVFFPKEDAERYLRRFQEVIAADKPLEYTDRIEVATGVRWFFSIVFPVKDARGEIYGVQVVSHDVTERRNAEEELRALSAHLQSVREEERTRISREIHDELGQTLTCLKLDLALIEKHTPEHQKVVHERIASMYALLEGTLNTVRRIAADLRPGVLDDLGLWAAMEWQAAEFSRRSGIGCSLSCDAKEIDVDPERSTAIFRIFQETLTNVARHAQAKNVQAKLRQAENKLILEVMDDGVGMDEASMEGSQSLGLLGIRERAYAWGGRVEIDSSKGQGTKLTVWITLDEKPPPPGDS